MNKLSNYFLGTLLGLILIIGCTKNIETLSAPIDRPPLGLADPTPVVLENITWYVTEHEGVTYFSIKSDDYKKLAVNMEKIQSFILNQKDIIEAQKNYYESGDE